MQQSARRKGGVDGGRDVVRRELRLGGHEGVEPAGSACGRRRARRRARRGRRRAVDLDLVVLARDRVRPLGPAALRAHRDHLDVQRAQQSLHRPGQRRGAEPPRPARSGRRAGCRGAAGSSGSRASPLRDPLVGSARSGQSACLGEDPRGSGRRRRRRPRPCAGPGVERADGPASSPRAAAAALRCRRRRGPSATSGSSSCTFRCTGPSGQPGEPRRRCRRALDDVGGRQRPADAEEPDLVGGLVRHRAAQPGRPVGGDRDQRDAGVRGLEHGRVQVGRGGARRRHHRGRRREVFGDAERQERRGALVDAGVQRQRARSRGVVQGEGQRCVARTGRQHDVAHADAEQRLDDALGPACCCCSGPSSVGVTTADPATRRRPGGARQCSTPVRGRPPTGRAASADGSGRRTGSAPSTGSSGSSTTSPASSWTVASPQACWSSGSAAASATPAAMPDAGLQGAADHDRQADVLGDPQAGADAAQRLHLEHRDVGGVEVADPVGVLGAPDRLVGGDRHVDPAADQGQVLHVRDRLLDVLQAAGGAVEPRDRATASLRPTSRRWRRSGSARRRRGRRGRLPAAPRPGRAAGRARRP